MIGAIVTLIVFGTIAIFYLNTRPSAFGGGSGTGISLPGITLGGGNKIWVLIWVLLAGGTVYWIGPPQFLKNLWSGAQTQTARTVQPPQGSTTLWKTIVDAPLFLQLFAAAGLMGVLYLVWWTLFGKVWVKTTTDADGKPIAVNEQRANLRRLVLILLSFGLITGVTFLTVLLINQDWSGYAAPNLDTFTLDAVWHLVKENLPTAFMLLLLVSFALAYIFGGIQNLFGGGVWAKYMVGAFTLIAAIGIVIYVAISPLTDEQKGVVKKSYGEKVVCFLANIGCPKKTTKTPRMVTPTAPTLPARTYFDASSTEVVGAVEVQKWMEPGATYTVHAGLSGTRCLMTRVSQWVEMDGDDFPEVTVKLMDSITTERFVDLIVIRAGEKLDEETC